MTDARAEFVARYEAARVVLTCHERLDAWLMPDRMHAWWEYEHLTAEGFDDDEIDAIAASNAGHRYRSLLAVEHSAYRNRVLAAPAMFVDAANQPAGRDWLGELSATARRWHTRVGLEIADAGRWAAAAGQLPTGSSSAAGTSSR